MTELVTHMLRVEDPSIAALENRIIRGRSTGFTEIQVSLYIKEQPILPELNFKTNLLEQ